MIEIVELAKLAQSQKALTAAYRLGLPLQEAGWMLFPAAHWDKPAIVAMDGGRCVAGLNYTADEDDRTLTINFAFAEPSHPRALAVLLLRFRSKFRGSMYEHVGFVCHAGNLAMAKAVEALKPELRSMAYRFPINSPALAAEPTEQSMTGVRA